MKHTNYRIARLLWPNLSLGTPPGKTNSSVVPTLYPFPDALFPSPPSPARLELVPNPVSDDAIDSRPFGAPPSSSDLWLPLLREDLDFTMTAAGELDLIQDHFLDLDHMTLIFSVQCNQKC